MKQPTLYLMLGYPGAGKTTVAKIIHDLTGAVHLWADEERRHKFGAPTYSHQENLLLYEQLNLVAERLLREGKSVIYDTNFNFHRDRERMRTIAKKVNANAIVIWVSTPKEIARDRAIDNAHLQRTRVLGNIPAEDFERMSRNLELPHNHELRIEIEGTTVSERRVKELLTAHGLL